MTRKKYNVISLFSGCGGLDLGLLNSNSDNLNCKNSSPFNFVWANDVLSYSCKTFSKNFDKDLEKKDPYNKNTIYCGDVKKVDFEKLDFNEDIDLVVGGFPCKDFSLLRGDDNRKGINVERGRLYMDFVRSLISLQPDMFVAENVKGLVSANNGKSYETILDDFTNLNSNYSRIKKQYEKKSDFDFCINKDYEDYKILFSDVIDFSKFGVPQGRERLIIIGIRDDLCNSRSNYSHKIKENLNKNFYFSEFPLTPIEVFSGKTLNRLDDRYKDIMLEYQDYIGVLDSERSDFYENNIWENLSLNILDDYMYFNKIKHISIPYIVNSHKKILDTLGYKKSLDGKKFEDGSNEEMKDMEHVMERLRHIPPGENHEMVKGTEHHVSGMMSNIYKRTNPIKPAPTVIAKGGGGTWGYHYIRERGKLTNRERARLQSFPDDFEFIGNNSEVREQIGNAVPPLGAKIIGESIIDILNKSD